MTGRCRMHDLDTTAMLSKVFARVAFYPSLAFGYAMTQVTRRRWFDRIDNTVVLGALPLRKVVAPTIVQKENVKGIISLVEPYETSHIPDEKEWKEMGISRYLWLPTRDYWGAPTLDDLDQALQLLDQHRTEASSVYVHCKAGRTRSATVVACYLIKRYSLTPADAVEFIRSRRPHIWLRTGQWSCIHQFYESLAKDGSFRPIRLQDHPDLKR